MILPDVNILVCAHREDAPNHKAIRGWLEKEIGSGMPFGLSDQMLSGFIRVVTHPGIFNPPSPLKAALDFAGELRGHPNCVHINPGDRHWVIFRDLCSAAETRGNHVPDAWFAALAMESGSEWITTDHDYGRFPKLKWRHPLGKG